MTLKDQILAALAVISLFLGRLPKIGIVVQILTTLVVEYWDQLSILIDKSKKLKGLTAKLGKAKATAEEDGLFRAVAKLKAD